MNLTWIGLWLLSASWLFGVDYFFKAMPLAGASLLALGTLLFCWGRVAPSGPLYDPSLGRNSPKSAALALAWAFLVIPAILLLPWPGRIGPLFLLVGVLMESASFRLDRSTAHESKKAPDSDPIRLRAMAARLSLVGTILLAQFLALTAYKHFTARSHELPWPLPQGLAGFLRLLGVQTAADGSTLALPTMRETHRLAATWELLLDPATFCFMVGGSLFVLLSVREGTRAAAGRESGAEATERVAREPERSGGRRAGDPKARWVEAAGHSRLSAPVRAVGWLLLAAAVWLPVRIGLHAGVFLHRALRTDYESPLNLMNQLWSPWPQLALLLPLALLSAWWLRSFHSTLAGGAPAGSMDALTSTAPWRAAGLAGAAVAALTLAVLWDPVGRPKAGRMAVDEFHSKWEPTDRPMDTEWYGHLSGYNYACLYDYCSHHYEMSRLTNALTDAALANLDVLIAKVPTEPFQPAEIDVVERFVSRGGGLLLIGEHTDVFNTGYRLNQLARRFGFEFQYDCLFGMESFFDQFYEPPPWKHPVLQHLKALDFATSCSLQVHGAGRGVIVSTGLKNSMADYHANNYYPQAVDHAAMRSGAFVQLWAARRGQGRVLAFTDSTIFSNFSAFEPGKSELFLGMLEWLNRQDRFGEPRPFLLGLGLLLLAGGLWQGGRKLDAFRWLLAAGLFAWSATSVGIIAYQRQALPAPKPVRPLTWVTIDRTLCEGPLSKGGFIAGKTDGFGIFERWILRLGYFIKRVSEPDAPRGDLAVFFYPTKPVTPEFRQSMIRFVEGGGRVLILDSPKNEKSTGGALLAAFGFSQKALPGTGGTLSGPPGWPAVPIEAAHEIIGGRTLFRLDGRTVGAIAQRGQGTVVALGFGSRFSDGQMGVTGDVIPDDKLRPVFDLQFALLRSILLKEVEALAK